jgi:zinc protease
MLVLDAALTGAKGVNLWASFRTPPPQRSARLYRALVDGGFASAVNGGLVATQEPFLYTISVTATEGTPLAAVEEATLAQIDAARRHGITAQELQKAKNQLRARSVFEGDSISNIAHQLGYFETVASWRLVPSIGRHIDSVTLDAVGEAAARWLRPTNRTIGWFDPQPAGNADSAPIGDPSTRSGSSRAESSDEGAGAGPASAR